MLDLKRIKGLLGRQSSSRKTDADKALDALARSSRIGTKGGRPAMPFHCHIDAAKAGDGTGAIDYLAREGDYADRDDLVHLAGDPEAVRDAVDAVDRAVRIRRGPTTERIMQREVFELPAATTREAAAAAAEAEVARWRQRGHEAVVAVHFPASKSDGRVNPHIHVAATARPVQLTPEGWQVDRRPQTLTVGKGRLIAERQAICDVINNTMAAHNIDAPLFVPGKLSSVGIERKARKRVPEAAYHRGQLYPDPAQVSAARERHLAKAAEAADRRKAEELERFHRLDRRGLIKASRAEALVDRARTEARRAAEELVDRAQRERDQAQRQAAELVELVEGLKVKHADDQAATLRQVQTMQAMAAERGLVVNLDAPMTVGTVGATIRVLKDHPPIARQLPQDAQEAPARPAAPENTARPPSGPESGEQIYAPFPVDPGAKNEAGREILRMTDAEVLGRLRASRAAPPSSAPGAALELKIGGKLLEAEARRRGLEPAAPASGRPSPIPRGFE